MLAIVVPLVFGAFVFRTLMTAPKKLEYVGSNPTPNQVFGARSLRGARMMTFFLARALRGAHMVTFFFADSVTFANFSNL